MKKNWIRTTLLLMAAITMATVTLRHLDAVSTVFWRSSSYTDFSQGQLDGISLSRDGRLSIAPALRPVFESGQAIVWSAVADHKGDVYLATGHRGRIYRLTPAMLAANTPVAPDKALLFTAPESEIFSLAIGPDGALYAGTAPNGKVYRITADGRSSVYFDPHERYIWSLAFSGSTLYVGTGEQGVIYRVTAAEKGSRFVDTRERQIMSLAVTKAGDLLAGTEPGGLVFRIQPDGHAFVLYRSDLKEIHRLDVAEDGSIYVTAQGGGTPRLPAHPEAPVTAEEMPHATAHISVTVQGSSGNKIDPTQRPSATASSRRSAAQRGSATAVQRLGMGVPGADSAIYRIAADGSVDTLWNSHEANADDVLPSPQGLLFATDDDGAIFQLGDNRATTVLVQTGQEETTRLLRLGDRILATTRNLGNLYEVSGTPADSGSFVSSVRDAGGISRWGDITWRVSQPAGARIEFYTRSGNSPEPDFSWSPWSPAYSTSGSRIASPAARYIQWKAVLHSSRNASPVLSEVVIPYLPANRAPQITAIQATNQSAAGSAVNYITGPGGTVIPAPSDDASAGRVIHLGWTAQDPDNDALRYDVYFQVEGQSGWNILRRGVAVPTLNVTSHMLPDGAYRFKIVASDADANPPGMAKSSEIISSPVTLDTTPPLITAGRSETPAAGVGVAHFSATDPTTPLQRAEFSIDGGPWRYLLSDSGIIDKPHETFTVRAEHLSPGEHLLMLRVFDESGNSSAAKALVTVK